ncbi:hypothetical protein B5P46_11910 [Rhizobium leguminosarum]|uniref:Uncharacterized protein n=1 Tax=Rhizobium leguminosarum TaxID=384 RepID=A0A4Q1UBJ7_RHILE|nr:hypothetical protein [Rhizobium leguminosarum]RXT29379.1 hypothetical protein B5P46_11910 [Rhizobium leguminosarum]
MPQHRFQANEEWNAGIDAASDKGYRTLAYSGSLGGGTLSLATGFDGGLKIPVSDAELDATKVDDNGDAIKQFTFQSAGNVFVTLAGATTPDVTVVVI